MRDLDRRVERLQQQRSAFTKYAVIVDEQDLHAGGVAFRCVRRMIPVSVFVPSMRASRRERSVKTRYFVVLDQRVHLVDALA